MFALLQGVVDVLCEACEQLKWKAPTKIQKEAIPVALHGQWVTLNLWYNVATPQCDQHAMYRL